MLPMPVNISAGTPKPAIHLTWKQWYLLREAAYYWDQEAPWLDARAWLLEHATFDDDYVSIF